MPLVSSMVGRVGTPATEHVERRWLMNYAASVGDENPVWYDTTAEAPLPAHPAYVSQLEWVAIDQLLEHLVELSPEERFLGVQSFVDTTIHRPVKATQELVSIAEVAGVESCPAGARLTVRIETVSEAGAQVSTSFVGMVYRSVEVVGRIAPTLPAIPTDDRWAAERARDGRVHLSSIAPHVFSECARDYSPIHTDLAVATSAGLPGLILHGTATMAFFLSDVVRHEAAGDPLVRRFTARFGAMVLCPSILSLRVTPHMHDSSIHKLEAFTQDGGLAIKAGAAWL